MIGHHIQNSKVLPLPILTVYFRKSMACTTKIRFQRYLEISERSIGMRIVTLATDM